MTDPQLKQLATLPHKAAPAGTANFPFTDTLGSWNVALSELATQLAPLMPPPAPVTASDGCIHSSNYPTLQEAVDAAAGFTWQSAASHSRRQGRYPLVIDPGGYTLTAPLHFYGIENMDVRMANCLFYGNAVMDSIFDIVGCGYMKFSGPAYVIGTQFVKFPMHIYQDTSLSQSGTTGLSFERILAGGNCQTCWQIGKGSGQCDTLTFTDCGGGGQWTEGETTKYQATFCFGDGSYGNCLDMKLNHPYSSATRYHVIVNECQLDMEGGDFSIGEYILFSNASAGHLKASGFRAETLSKGVINESWGSPEERHVSITDFTFVMNGLTPDANGQARLVDWKHEGGLNMRAANFVGDIPVGVEPIINFDPPNRGALLIQDMGFQGRTPDQVFRIGVSGVLKVEGFHQRWQSLWWPRYTIPLGWDLRNSNDPVLRNGSQSFMAEAASLQLPHEDQQLNQRASEHSAAKREAFLRLMIAPPPTDTDVN